MIKNINYVDEEIFKNEINSLFSNRWIYIGLKSQLKNNNDFVTYEMGPYNIVVQNFNGVLKCFENVCLHRFNNIQSGYSGNDDFICNYHSWCYGTEGKVKSPATSAANDKLKEYEIDFCGEFVFVNLGATDSLQNQLGFMVEKLKTISMEFDSIINEEIVCVNHHANWKLLVENVLECYHCSSVHKNTLVPMGIGLGTEKNHFNSEGNDIVDFTIRRNAKVKERDSKLNFLANRNYRHDSFRHFYVFPNLFISSNDGIIFYVGQLIPVSKGLTKLKINLIKPKIKVDLIKDKYLINAFYSDEIIKSTLAVIDEDKAVIESINSNLEKHLGKFQMFEKKEFRIVEFHNWLHKSIEYK